MKQKKIIFFIIFIFFINSCSIGNYEIVNKKENDNLEKKIDKLSLKINNLEEELKIFRKENLSNFVEKNIEKQVKKEFENLKKEELEKEKQDLEKLAKQNKLLEKQNEEIDKKIEKASKKIKTGKYCILDTCMYKKNFEIENFGKISKIFEEKDFFINLVGNNCNLKDLENKEKKCFLASKMTKSKSFLEKVLNFGEKNKEIVYINHFIDFYIKTNISITNNKKIILQKIFSKKAEKIDKKNAIKFFNSNFNLFTNNFKINNLEFEINPIIEKDFDENIKLFDNKNYFSSKEISDTILKNILETKKFYKTYIFPIDKEKASYISYELKNKIPERLIFLGTNKKDLEKILKDNKIIDKDLNNKILSYFKDYKILDLDKKEVKEFSLDKKPIFKVEKFDEKGNYLLYFTEFYSKEKKSN